MLDESRLERDLMCCKALCMMDGQIRWYRCMLLSANGLGQYHVRRLRTGEEAITTQIRNLTDNDRVFIRNNYL